MKIVVDNRMVAHLWANKSQPHARSGNMRFDGDRIYSYSSEIGRHVVGCGGQPGVLLSCHGWSKTTSAHQRYVRGAIRPGVAVFHVAETCINPLFPATALREHERNTADYLERMRGLAVRAKRARKYGQHYMGSFLSVANEANAYATFFGLDWQLPADMTETLVKAEELAEAMEATEKVREAARAAKLAGRAEEWKAGANVRIGEFPTILLRVRGDEVQTSRGAVFPLEHARKAFRLIAICKEKGQGWERNGHSIHLGHFALDSVSKDGDVVAGCHRIAWAEIERIARLVGEA